jgi:hypothetical protein
MTVLPDAERWLSGFDDVLAALLAAPVVEFVGGHVGYATDPVEFVAQLGASALPGRAAPA